MIKDVFLEILFYVFMSYYPFDLAFMYNASIDQSLIFCIWIFCCSSMVTAGR